MKMGAGHQPLVGEQHRGSRGKTDGQASVSWDHMGSSVSRRDADQKDTGCLLVACPFPLIWGSEEERCPNLTLSSFKLVLTLSSVGQSLPLSKRANGIPLNTIQYHWTIQWYFSRTQWYSQW